MVESIFGYEFRNGALLEEALTTPSCRQTDPTARDNQRLEFLGDAVLGVLAADLLYASRPRDSEGQLTVRRANMVSAPALCAAAAKHDLASRLRRNKGAAPIPANVQIVTQRLCFKGIASFVQFSSGSFNPMSRPPNVVRTWNSTGTRATRTRQTGPASTDTAAHTPAKIRGTM